MTSKVSIPPYGHRNNWIPRRSEVIIETDLKYLQKFHFFFKS